jgi:hypothetical protein
MTERKRVAKVLMPVVASLASAFAGYLAKKAPQYLEDALMPRVRETKEAATTHPDIDNDELERRRRERAEHRAARRRAS